MRPQALFPYRLYDLLEAANADGFEDVISWLPCGTAFKIHNIEAFKRTILWEHFRLNNYKSFQRNVNLYEIKQGGGLGSLKGAYRHPNFVRGKPELLKLMKRKVKSRSKKLKQAPSSIDLGQQEATSFWTEEAIESSKNSSQSCGSSAPLLGYKETAWASFLADDATQYRHLVEDEVVDPSPSNKEVAAAFDTNSSSKPLASSSPIEEDYSADDSETSPKNWFQTHEEILLQYSQMCVQEMADAASRSPVVLDEYCSSEAEKLSFRRDVGVEVIDTFSQQDLWEMFS